MMANDVTTEYAFADGQRPTNDPPFRKQTRAGSPMAARRHFDFARAHSVPYASHEARLGLPPRDRLHPPITASGRHIATGTHVRPYEVCSHLPPHEQRQLPNAYFQPPNAYFQPPNAYFQPPSVVQETVRPDRQNPFPKGRNCVVYDPESPSGQKRKSFTPESIEDRRDSADDIAEKMNDLKLDIDKSPVAKLNEIMLSKKQVVNYNLVGTTGQLHNPIFTICAKTEEITAYGSGSSKKEAKKNAAVAFMSIMDSNDGHNTITSSTTQIDSSIDKDHKEKILDEKSELNPIGLLQELCIAYHWPLPDYKFIKIINSETSHIPCYTVECSLRNYNAKGSGKTKQFAKRQSALFMYNMVKDTLNKSTIVDLRKEAADLCSPNVLKKVEVFFGKLKLSQKPYITKLKKFDNVKEFCMSSVDVLNKIGEEEGFNVTYILIPANSTEVVLVEVRVYPLVKLIGEGPSFAEAEESAATTVLVYFKLFLQN